MPNLHKKILINSIVLSNIINETKKFFIEEVKKANVSPVELNLDEGFPLFNPSSRVSRKKKDTTKYTQYMFDYIMKAHKLLIIHNEAEDIKGKGIPRNYETIDDLIIIINKTMDTNKSRTSISSIWNGKVKRETLAVGKPYFEWGI